jgi:hypothetical protein
MGGDDGHEGWNALSVTKHTSHGFLKEACVAKEWCEPEDMCFRTGNQDSVFSLRARRADVSYFEIAPKC